MKKITDHTDTSHRRAVAPPTQQTTRGSRIAVVANIAWHLYNFRMGLIQALEDDGHTVVMMAAPDGYVPRIEKFDRKFVPLDKLRRTGMNPIHDLELLYQVFREYKRNRIDIAIHYTSKGNIYGGLASRLARIPSIHTVNGLGGPFSGRGRMVQAVASMLYRMSFSESHDVYFQNQHDQDFFTEQGIITPEQARVVSGSGIDLEKFTPRAESDALRSSRLRILLFSRLSKTKGILEYVEASRLLRSRECDIEFQLAGRFDEDRHAISRSQISEWEGDGLIKFLGSSDDIIELIATSDFVVYPSYYMEGIPRALIEACAMAKPIITTDHVGCRETVAHGKNGLLVPIRDSQALAEAIIKIASMPSEQRLKMGAQSRILAEQRFDQRIVNIEYLSSVNRLLANYGRIPHRCV